MNKSEAAILLGVNANADEKEIKKAFKRKAMKYHPDRPTGDEDKFKEFSQARDVLLAPEEEMDLMSQMFRQAQRQQQQAMLNGDDCRVDMKILLTEAFTGVVKRATGPSGNVDIKIPKGILHGQRVRVAGKGFPPKGDGGTAGDLYVFIHIMDHPTIKVEGLNSYTEIDLPLLDAIYGTELHIETLHGVLNTKIPAGTQSGTRMKLANKGPAYISQGGSRELFGSHFVLINVVIPDCTKFDEMIKEYGYVQE